MPVAPGLYSRIVAILKVGLPLVALGMLSALFLIQPEERIGGGGLEFSPGDLAALGSGLRVSNPTFSGTTIGGDRFRFTAELVVPDAAPPTRASITALSGRLDFADGGAVALAAAAGELEIPAHLLALSGAVRIETSDGYRISAERVALDLGTGVLETGATTKTEGPLGRIDSGSLRIAPAEGVEDAHRFSFGEGVRVIYIPPASE
jgi:lipopolysaccharide export system protein LptC